MARPRRRSSSFSCASCRPGAAFWSRPGSSRRWTFSKACVSRPEELDWLARSGRFGKGLLEHLAGSSFHRRRACHARKGTVFFADEPILRVTAPLPRGAAGGDAAHQHPAFPVADRRQGGAHGACGAGQAAGRFRPAPRARRRGRPHGGARELHRGFCRHRHHAGRASGSAFRPSARWRIPSSRPTTTRLTAFEEFAQSRPDNLTLLIDTYDTEAAARKVVALAPRLKARGHHDPRRAAGQRRSHRALQERAAASSTQAGWAT